MSAEQILLLFVLLHLSAGGYCSKIQLFQSLSCFFEGPLDVILSSPQASEGALNFRAKEILSRRAGTMLHSECLFKRF